jgi:hypothetical protein
MKIIYQKEFYHLKDKRFYTVLGHFGDPQGAHESGYKILPDEFIHAIVMNENGSRVEYATKKDRTLAWKNHPYFWDFYISREELTKILNNKLKKIKK